MERMKIKKSLVPQLNCAHADTCMPDYWGGHHLAHISIMVYGRMSMKDIKAALHSEINEGAIGGSDERAFGNSGEMGDAWIYRAHAAINRIMPNQKYKRVFFEDVPIDEEYPAYAYFCFE